MANDGCDIELFTIFTMWPIVDFCNVDKNKITSLASKSTAAL